MEKMLEKGGKVLAVAMSFALPLLPAVGHAAVPAVVGTTLATVQTDALAVIDLIWPVVLAVLGGFILMKIVRRGASKI